MNGLFQDAVPSAPSITVERLAHLFSGYRFPVGVELAFQNALEQVLTRHGIAHERERVLGTFGTVDFFIPDAGIGIELKVKGSPSEVTRQLHRYAQSLEVKALILVTGRARLGRLPETLNSKPITVVSCWEALL